MRQSFPELSAGETTKQMRSEIVSVRGLLRHSKEEAGEFKRAHESIELIIFCSEESPKYELSKLSHLFGMHILNIFCSISCAKTTLVSSELYADGNYLIKV